MKKILVAVLCLFIFSIPAFATDLVNKDSVKYRVEIKPDSYTRTEMDVASSSTYSDKLKKGYVIINLTTGEKITVTTDKKVLIENGKFKQE
jgi:intein/homing endonuclease